METKKSSLKKVMKLQLVLFLAIITITNTYAQDNFKIDLVDNNIKIYRQDKLLIDIVSIMFNFVEPDSVILNKVTSNGVVLNLVLEGPDGFHENFPKIVPVTIQYTNNTIHFFAEHETFNHITIRMNDLQEHYYGLIEKLYPHNSTNPDLRGNVIDVDVYSEGSSEYAENYASAYSAFYMSSKGYGSFFDTFARGRYHFAINGITEIYHQTNKLDWYIFYGPTGDKIHKEYYDLIGSPKYVPMWALGPLFWRDQNNGGSEEILNDIKQYTDLKIPLTSCWVDRPYSDGANEWSMMNFNNRFANPEKWIKTINEKYGMQFMTWVGPMTFDDYNFPGLLPNYKNYIDLTNPEALNEFENRLVKYQYSVNVRGHKMDRADESFPFTSQWFEGKSESQSRNKYIYLYSKVIDKFLNNALGKNNFNFARAAFHRSQPFLSAVWGGDSRNNWIGLRGNMANAIRCSFMGFPIWGTDTGGYLGEGKIDETLYIRWLQFAAWNGMFEVKIDGAPEQEEKIAHPGTALNNFRMFTEISRNIG